MFRVWGFRGPGGVEGARKEDVRGGAGGGWESLGFRTASSLASLAPPLDFVLGLGKGWWSSIFGFRVFTMTWGVGMCELCHALGQAF